MKIPLFVTACVIFLSLFPHAAVPQSSLGLPSTQEITPSFAKSPPSIDGKLDDECWQSAPTAADFKLGTGRGLARCRTTARICCDAGNVYIAFECVEPEIEKLTANIALDDEPVWRDDCVEVFIAPHAVATGENFHHFVVNPLGSKAYLIAESPQPKKDKWRAAASKSGDRWFAEMAIPLKVLTPAGLNEPYWRINFCRVDLVHAEESSWSEVPNLFKSFWRFGRLMQPKDGPGFIRFRGKPQPITSNGVPAGARIITRIPEEPVPTPVVIPEPRVMRYSDGVFAITPGTRILIGGSDDPMDRRPAEEINEELQRVAGFTLPIEIVKSSGEADWKNCIVVGERRLNPAADDYCRSKGIRLSPTFPGEEGYVLEVGSDAVLVAGSDQLGTFWGAQTLRRLVRRNLSGASAGVPCVSIRDWPRFGYRGVHLLATTDALSFHGRMIEKVFSRFKINNIVLECEHVEWDSHPEIRNPARAMPKEDVRKLIEIAKDHRITVTPLLQSLGHMEWAFYGSSNLEMVEDPARPYAYCPLNPRSHNFMADLIDETIELFGHPEYVHMGRDEFDMRGAFPFHEECRRIGKDQLYIDDAVWNYGYLKSRGAKMMMWGDVLSKAGFREKLDQLPKDIVICDWRYGPSTEYPTLSLFKQRGFPVIGCTWYNPTNLYNFSADAYRRGIQGMMQTTWTGFWPEDRVLKEQFQQIHSYILGAAWAWSPGTPKLGELPYESDQVFSELWFTGESKALGAWFDVDLAPFYNISLKDRKDRIGWLGLGRGNDLSGLPKGIAPLGGVPFNLGTRQAGILLGGPPGILDGFGDRVAGIPVGNRADRLYFLQTAAFGDRMDLKAGEYVVNHEDGSTEVVDLIYGKTISAWDSSRPAARTRSAWRGTTSAGEIARVNVLVWDNPHPEKIVRSFDFRAVGGQAAPVLIAVTGEVGKE